MSKLKKGLSLLLVITMMSLALLPGIEAYASGFNQPDGSRFVVFDRIEEQAGQQGFFTTEQSNWGNYAGVDLKNDELYNFFDNGELSEEELTKWFLSYELDGELREGEFAWVPVLVWGSRAAYISYQTYRAGQLVATGITVYAGGMSAREIIRDTKLGSINREFPSEMYDKTLEQIEHLAKQGNKAAKKAKKLLTDKRFNKK